VALRILVLGGARLDDLVAEILAGGFALGELLVGRDAAEARAGQRRVRAALAVREDRDAAAREVVAVGAGEGSLGLGLRELRVRLDVDLPARQARGESGVRPSLPIASASWSSGTTTVASLVSSSI